MSPLDSDLWVSVSGPALARMTSSDIGSNTATDSEQSESVFSTSFNMGSVVDVDAYFESLGLRRTAVTSTRSQSTSPRGRCPRPFVLDPPHRAGPRSPAGMSKSLSVSVTDLVERGRTGSAFLSAQSGTPMSSMGTAPSPRGPGGAFQRLATLSEGESPTSRSPQRSPARSPQPPSSKGTPQGWRLRNATRLGLLVGDAALPEAPGSAQPSPKQPTSARLAPVRTSISEAAAMQRTNRALSAPTAPVPEPPQSPRSERQLRWSTAWRQVLAVLESTSVTNASCAMPDSCTDFVAPVAAGLTLTVFVRAMLQVAPDVRAVEVLQQLHTVSVAYDIPFAPGSGHALLAGTFLFLAPRDKRRPLRKSIRLLLHYSANQLAALEEAVGACIAEAGENEAARMADLAASMAKLVRWHERNFAKRAAASSASQTAVALVPPQYA